MSEAERNSRREFLKKLGIGAAVVASPVVIAGCFPTDGGNGTHGHTYGSTHWIFNGR